MEKNVFWVGGIEGYKTEELENLYWFSADMPEKMQSPRLSRDYRDFDEYCSIAKATQDVEMNQAIRLLDDFFPLPQKLAIMRRQVVTHEKDAQVTVSTAHRSKGLEWPVVMLSEDFTDITDPLLSQDERQDETNLLYVAVTRARRTLVLNELMRWLSDEGGKTARRRTKPYRPEMERAPTGTKKREKLLRVSNWFFMVKRGSVTTLGSPIPGENHARQNQDPEVSVFKR
jgi:ATP-dependent exoDNAse (exonuclease V) beta subunit